MRLSSLTARPTAWRAAAGFNLIEVLIVMVLIGILVAIIIPNYQHTVIKAREAVLKENLFMIRDAINKYYHDKETYPTSLEDLVTHHYLRAIPVDPITKSNTWDIIRYEPIDSADYDPEVLEGIVDVKSLARGTASDGTSYSEW